MLKNKHVVTKVVIKYPPLFQPNFVIPNTYKPYRYAIGKDGKHPLICIGMNPSAANEQYSDRTVNKVIKYAIDNNYDGWIMLNIYPQRATNASLHLSSCLNKIYHKNNINCIIEIIKKYKVNELWGAWGDIDKKRKWLYDVKNEIISAIKKCNCKIFYFGNITKYNNPPHPLYLKLENKKYF